MMIPGIPLTIPVEERSDEIINMFKEFTGSHGELKDNVSPGQRDSHYCGPC